VGVDAVMAVALENESDVEILNERFRNTHEQFDSTFGGRSLSLIGCQRIKDDEYFEYINTYYVDTGLQRLYSEGYERGDCFKLITQLEWLRSQPEVIEVYYGGDCYDYPSLWTKEDSIGLLFHFFKFGHTPYRKPSKWEVK